MKVKTLEPIHHDGERIEPGTLLDLSDADAKILIELEAVERADLTKATNSKKGDAKA